MLVNNLIQTSTKSFFTINNGMQDSLIIHDILNFKTATPFQNRSKLIIKITDTNKTLITSARITSISTPFDQIPFDIITNSTGFASISDLSQGNYKFKIEKEGYKTIERSTVIGVGNTYTYIYELDKSSSIPFLISQF